MSNLEASKASSQSSAMFRPSWRDLLTGAETSIGVTLFIVVMVGVFWVGPTFVSSSNLSIIGLYLAIPMLIAATSSFALLAGVVDLSIGSMVGFSSCFFALLVGTYGWDLWSAGAVCIITCVAFGSINAVSIVVFGADAVAATLGMLVGLRGAAYLLSLPSGQLTAFDVNFYDLTNQNLGPLPLLFIISLIIIAIAGIVVSRTRLGRHVKAVGGDERAATRAGISVARVRFGALILSAFGAGLGGILYVGLLGSASNVTGTGLEFQVYAAMMIGGYSILRGGVGNPLGAALGMLVVAGTANILDVQAISPYYTNIIVGLLLLAAVLLDRLRGGDAFN